MPPTVPLFSKAVMLCDDGLVLGAGTRLAHFARGSSRLAIDPDRVTGLIATTFRRSPSDRDLSAIEAAAMHWQRGDKALANLRLVFAKLPQLEAPADVYRLKAAELLFDAGLTADDLAKQLGAAPGAGHYDPNQPRVAPGNGRRSGRWTDDVWSRFSAWLDEEVPVYDQDTGDEVGTQSRARAIATNPLAILGVGAAIIAGGEFLAPAAVVGATAEATAAGAAADAAVVGATAEAAAAVAPAAEEAETLTPFAQRYLSTSGGRLGNTTTRQQLYEIARDYVKSDEFVQFEGDGEAGEEYIPGAGPGTNGSTFVDFTAWRTDGSAVRIQTIDTLSDGLTPNAREMDAAGRIKAAFPSDKLTLIPKRPR